MSDWRKERIALIANGLHINRDELERLVDTATTTTGDPIAMNPLNRAKLKDEPLTRLADMGDVSAAKREAMDYTDDMFARTIKRVQALEDGRKPAATPSPSYFFRAQQEIADLREENARLGEKQAAAKQCDALVTLLAETNLALRRENDNIREGREKAVARCVELEEVNGYLRGLLGARR